MLPGGRRTTPIGSTAREEKHITPPGSIEEPGGGTQSYFGSSFSAAELMQ